MNKKLAIALLPVVMAGLSFCGGATAEEATNYLVIASFRDGFVTWTNVNSNLYYTVEYKPNLSGTATPRDGSHRVSQDVKSSAATITAPVGVYYRVVGSTNPMHSMAMTPKTGQATSYQPGDDGDYMRGSAWPQPRFTIGAGVDGTNCVTDNLTGLVWARNANLAGAKTWVEALDYCKSLTYGGTNDWRLPNVREIQSLIDYGRSNPALSDTSGVGQWVEDDPFKGVQSDYYWTSTSYAAVPDYAWYVYLFDGFVVIDDKASSRYVWPVRGGQGR